MVAPVWSDAGLNLFVETLLHAIHVFELVGLDALVLALLAASTSVLEA